VYSHCWDEESIRYVQMKESNGHNHDILTSGLLLELLTVELKLILNMLVIIHFLVTFDVYNLFIIVSLHIFYVCICTFLLYSYNHFHGTMW
jgi:hypothetical protein